MNEKKMRENKIRKKKRRKHKKKQNRKILEIVFTKLMKKYLKFEAKL